MKNVHILIQRAAARAQTLVPKCRPALDPMQTLFQRCCIFVLFLLSSQQAVAQAGAALHFDGADDYVDCGMATTNFTGDLSIEFWFYRTVEPNGGIVSKHYTGEFECSIFGNLYYSHGQTAGGYFNWNTGAAPTTNAWTHFAVVRNAATKTVTVYKNGVLAATNTYTGGINTSTNSVQLGRRANEGTNGGGGLDEVRIWNRLLTPCEITNHMNCELIAANKVGLTAYYQFNQGNPANNNPTVTTLPDASGNNNQGTLINFGLTAGVTSNWIAPSSVANGTACTVTADPSVSITSNAGALVPAGTSVTFTATPTNGGGSPQYQWKKNGINVGTSSTTYSDAALINEDVITCTLTNASATCTTASSNPIKILLTGPAAALSFDGVDDYVAFPNTGVSAAAGTLEFWMKNDRLGLQSGLVDLGAGFSIFQWMDSYLYFYAGALETQFRVPCPTDKGWHHYALVWAGVGNPFYGYIDGVQVGTSTQGNHFDAYPTARIGRLVANECFLGAMDEVRVWTRALSVTELNAQKNCELSGPQTGLLRYYQFNQGTSNSSNPAVTTVTDASGNNQNGTLTNFALTGATSNWIGKGGIVRGLACTPSCGCNPACSPIPTATGTYTATVANVIGGYTHYCDGSGKLLLSALVPAGTTIPPAAVSVKIGNPTPTFYPKNCGGVGPANSCFMGLNGGSALINRFWHIDSVLVGLPAITATNPINIVSYFTNTEHLAVGTVLTSNSNATAAAAVTALTGLQLYQPNIGRTFGAFPDPSLIKPSSSAGKYNNNNGLIPSLSTWKLTTPQTGVNGAEFMTTTLQNSGGIGKFQ